MRIRIVQILALFIFAASAFASVAWAQSARKLNTEGLRLYKQKKYEKALEKFQASVEANPRYALAHYNLACTLGVLRKQGRTCEFDAYRGTIVEHLQKAVKLNPKRRKRILKDPDLDPVRDTFGYHTLIGLSATKTGDVKIILQNVTWYGPAPGAYGPHSGMDFGASGKMSMWTLDLARGDVHKVTQAGTFTVEGNKIRIKFDKPFGGKTEFEGQLKPDGELEIPDLPGPFTDDPDDCSA